MEEAVAGAGKRPGSIIEQAGQCPASPTSFDRDLLPGRWRGRRLLVESVLTLPVLASVQALGIACSCRLRLADRNRNLIKR